MFPNGVWEQGVQDIRANKLGGRVRRGVLRRKSEPKIVDMNKLKLSKHNSGGYRAVMAYEYGVHSPYYLLPTANCAGAITPKFGLGTGELTNSTASRLCNAPAYLFYIYFSPFCFIRKHLMYTSLLVDY